jgi:DNA-binding transcriptional LysR family regulator
VAVAASWLTGTYLLPDIIAEFKHQHPAVRVSLQLGTAMQAIDLLRLNRAELGFVAGTNVRNPVSMLRVRDAMLTPTAGRFQTFVRERLRKSAKQNGPRRSV